VILQVLRENKWNRRKAANVLNISYRALIYKIQEAGLAQRHHRKTTPAAIQPTQAIATPE
jgi:DNA-binding NtrC family response regulator